jgi:TolB-like protein/Tfp pilus assembly protein PilF
LSAKLAVAGVIVCAVVTFLLIWGFRHESTSASARPETLKIAVLPFEQFGMDDAHKYLGEGLTSELIARLSTAARDRLVVIAPSSAAQFTAQTPLNKIGHGLGVRYVLEGTVTINGDKTRVLAHLDDVRSATTLWSGNYELSATDALHMQQEVAVEVAREVARELHVQPQSVTTALNAGNVEAVQECLVGRFYWNQRTVGGFQLALEHFQKSLSIDPHYAPAYAGLADTYLMLGRGTPQYRQNMEKAKQAAAEALRLDTDLSEAHTSMAFIHYIYDWDWKAAEQEFRRALELNPSDSRAHLWYSLYLASMGRADEAHQEATAAFTLDPLSPNAAANIGWVDYLARRYDDANSEFQQALSVDPNFFKTYMFMGWAYQGEGRYRDAAETLHKLKELSLPPLPDVYLAQNEAAAGDVRGAKQILHGIPASALKTVSPYQLALLYGYLGEKEQAFHFLDLAYQQHALEVADLPIDPRMDVLRVDPRFQKVEARLGMGD